jgi:tetratricopeptide (TPR) repeat protein
MNFIFRAYPSHPWLTGWNFDPRGCGTSHREKSLGCFFQSLDTVGRIAPQLENPEWSLQVPVPQNSQINILFNGFCAYLEKRRKKFAAEVTVPEPGVLWGRYSGIPDPVLLTEETIDTSREFQWLENESRPVLLAIRGNTFCLITKSRIYADAAKLAEDYLERNIEQHLLEELNRRHGATRLFEEMSHHDTLTVICTECLMRAIHPPEGNIPLSWSLTQDNDNTLFNINELFPLATAWRLIDINVAEELVLCALKLQASSGSIPVLSAPHGIHSVLEAPKPLIAQTVEIIWNERRNADFLNSTIPLLRRYVQWMLHHFDPKNRGTYCWQNRNEVLVADQFESDLSSVDLAALLLAEIEALNRLREQSPDYAEYQPYFSDEQETLEHNLFHDFWNPEESSFTHAFVRGRQIQMQGFPSFTPLLLKNLPILKRTPIMDRIKAMDFLPGGLNILSWRKSALNDRSFSLIQQMILLQALKTADPNGMVLRDFSRLTLQGFVEWHTLSLEESGALEIDPAIAAYILNLQDTHQYRYHGKGRISGFFFKTLRKVRTDWFEIAVIVVTILSILSVRTIYRISHAPPPLEFLEAQMHSAYVNRDTDKTLEACNQIIRHYPTEADTARLFGANISLLQDEYENASTLLTITRVTYPDSPGPMIALGLAYQLQGRFREAEQNYAEFCYLFEEIFPELVDEINEFRHLMNEGFRAPPKWQEIYRYQLMHEL